MKEKKICIFLFCLVPVAIKKTGSLTSSTGKTKLIRRTSAKFRKPSIRRKDAGKSKNNLE
jgi:hypothetical protein